MRPRFCTLPLMLAALCCAGAVYATTVTVTIPTVGVASQSGPTASASLTGPGTAGGAFVDGTTGRLGGSSTATGLTNAASNVSTDSRTGALLYQLIGSGFIDISMSAVITADWSDGSDNASARVAAGFGFNTGDGDNFQFATPPNVGPFAGPATGRVSEVLSFTARLLAGRTYSFSADLQTQAIATCNGLNPPHTSCGTALMNASSTMTVFLDSISNGASLVQIGGDRLDLQSSNPPVPVPLPASAWLMIAGFLALRLVRTKSADATAS